MSGVVLKGQHEFTKLQEELLKRVDSPETHRRINEIIAEAAEPYVPRDTGKLATHYIARVDGILYQEDYARYQFYGKVMGPNRARFVNGKFHSWYTRKGTKKHLTGADIGDGTPFVDKNGIEFYTRHYTTPGTGPYWIWEMWKHDRRAVQNRITWYLKGLDK